MQCQIRPSNHNATAPLCEGRTQGSRGKAHRRRAIAQQRNQHPNSNAQHASRICEHHRRQARAQATSRPQHARRRAMAQASCRPHPGEPRAPQVGASSSACFEADAAAAAAGDDDIMIDDDNEPESCNIMHMMVLQMLLVQMLLLHQLLQ